MIFDLAPLGRFDAQPTADMVYNAAKGALASVIAEGGIGAGWSGGGGEKWRIYRRGRRR